MIEAMLLAVLIVFGALIVADFIRYVARHDRDPYKADEYKYYYWRCLKEAAKEVREERKNND